jgi:UDP-2,4-diacetamido-2,4,6-trideoxy-beta-L-altropyranose hydrolase
VNVAIRVDASFDIGIGHVMRCLAFANIMVGRGAAVAFLCRNQTGHLFELIREAGFAVATLPSFPATTPDEAALKGLQGTRWKEDAEESLGALRSMAFRPDLLVVDQYSLEKRWERALRPAAPRILVIDDLANREHDCDVLLDPNLHDSPGSRYTGLVGEHTRVFVGPQYALLRPEFDRIAPRTRDQGVRKMLVFFGGADPSNEALKIVHALRALATRAPRAVLVLGPISPHAQEIRRTASGLAEIEVIGATNEMARLMAESDLALGTCGGAAWERCVLGLPALVVVSAENQRDDARILHSLGAVRNLGEADDTSVETWVAAIAAMQDDVAALSAMSHAAQSVMQGRQAAMRDFESAIVH